MDSVSLYKIHHYEKKLTNPRHFASGSWSAPCPARTCGRKLENLVHHVRKSLSAACTSVLQGRNRPSDSAPGKPGFRRASTNNPLGCRFTWLPVARPHVQIVDDGYLRQWCAPVHAPRRSHL